MRNCIVAVFAGLFINQLALADPAYIAPDPILLAQQTREATTLVCTLRLTGGGDMELTPVIDYAAKTIDGEAAAVFSNSELVQVRYLKGAQFRFTISRATGFATLWREGSGFLGQGSCAKMQAQRF